MNEVQRWRAAWQHTGRFGGPMEYYCRECGHSDDSRREAHYSTCPYVEREQHLRDGKARAKEAYSMITPTTKQVQELAEAIARDLFTNGCGDRAQRLVLVIDDMPTRELGGWGEGPAADRIASMIHRYWLQSPPSPREREKNEP